MYPAVEACVNWPERPRPVRPGPLGRLRIDVDDGRQSVSSHGRCSARKHGRSAAREGTGRRRLCQQLCAMAATQPDERRWAEESGFGRLEGTAQLSQRAADIARVRSRHDE